MKIPKIIHYCWFGEGRMPKSHRKCLKSWKKLMPDYQFILWNESNFDIKCCSYSKVAYDRKKYAFVADVARCYALKMHGGIYLDTDVELFDRLDAYLNYDFFSAIEIYNEFYDEGSVLLNDNYLPKEEGIYIPHLGLLSSLMGCSPNNKLIRDCVNFYDKLEIYDDQDFSGIIIDGLLAKEAIKYGFIYQDKLQELSENMIIYPTGIFGYAYSPNLSYSVSYHHNAATWKTKSKKQNVEYILDQYGFLQTYTFLKKIKRKLLSK